METKVVNSKEVLVAPGFSVIGGGEIIDSPCQIGEWWCVPLSMYDKDIPAEGIERMAEILKSEIVVGLIIADDIRNVKPMTENKPMPEKKAVSIDKSELINLAATIITIGVTVMVGMAAIMLSVLAYDPIIIAILKDGSFVECYSWYE